MTRLLHISDLHYNKIDPHAERALLNFIDSQPPETTVICTGDLTMRCRKQEFQQAVKFFQNIKHHSIIIPGNHDINYFNPYLRFFQTFQQFHQYFPQSHPQLINNLKIIPFSTITPFSFGGGKITSNNFRQLLRRVAQTPQQNPIIIICHHPKLLWRYLRKQKPQILGKIKLILSGHTHRPYAMQMPQGPILSTTGTAISRRLRGQFPNIITTININSNSSINLTYHQYTNSDFTPYSSLTFQQQ